MDNEECDVFCFLRTFTNEYICGLNSRMEIKKASRFEKLFAVLTRLELATSCVTGRHSNQTELQHLLFFVYQPRYFVVDYGCKDTIFFQIRKYFFKKKSLFFSIIFYPLDYQENILKKKIILYSKKPSFCTHIFNKS